MGGVLGNSDISMLLWTGSSYELDLVASYLDTICALDIWRVPLSSIGYQTRISFCRAILQFQWNVLGVPRHWKHNLLLWLFFHGLVYDGASNDDIHNCPDQEEGRRKGSGTRKNARTRF